MTESRVDELREQLKSLGYLTRGIERWFALDPWSSRTFWAELLTITVKAATIAAPFAALPPLVVMLLRNGPLPFFDAALLAVLYLAGSFLAIAALIIGAAALLKLRPATVIERPGRAIWISLLPAGMVVAAVVGWWLGFAAPPSRTEALITAALVLLFLPIGSIAFSAALLSFSIYETHRIPLIHSRSRAVPLTMMGAVLLGVLLLIVPGARTEIAAVPPGQVVVSLTSVKVAFLGIDGLTREIFTARSDLQRLLPYSASISDPPAGSAPQTWATVGTGTPPEVHRVRSVEAIRFAGSDRALQSVSAFDVVLRDLAGIVGLTRRQPLPPTVRERHYVWEIAGGRGVSSLAVNWWASEDLNEPHLRSVSQETIYRSASAARNSLDLALAIDRAALGRLTADAADARLRLIAVYLPALDVVLNRLELDRSARLAASVQALDALTPVLSRLGSEGWTIVLTGLPGEGQAGAGVFASTHPIAASTADPVSVAPTLLDLLGFPASRDMPGASLLPGSQQARVTTFGVRRDRGGQARIDDEYYEKLRSLGYVR